MFEWRCNATIITKCYCIGSQLGHYTRWPWSSGDLHCNCYRIGKPTDVSCPTPTFSLRNGEGATKCLV